MEGLLLIAVIVLAAVSLIGFIGSSEGATTATSESDAESADGTHWFNPATGLPMMSNGPHGFDVAGNWYGYDDQASSMDRHDALAGPFDDFSSVRGGWPSDAVTAIGMDQTLSADPMASNFLDSHHVCINPATGLPMISDSEAGVDVGGNPYGFQNDDLFSHHDSFGSGFDSDSHSHFGSGTDWS